MRILIGLLQDLCKCLECQYIRGPDWHRELLPAVAVADRHLRTARQWQPCRSSGWPNTRRLLTLDYLPLNLSWALL